MKRIRINLFKPKTFRSSKCGLSDGFSLLEVLFAIVVLIGITLAVLPGIYQQFYALRHVQTMHQPDAIQGVVDNYFLGALGPYWHQVNPPANTCEGLHSYFSGALKTLTLPHLNLKLSHLVKPIDIATIPKWASTYREMVNSCNQIAAGNFGSGVSGIGGPKSGYSMLKTCLVGEPIDSVKAKDQIHENNPVLIEARYDMIDQFYDIRKDCADFNDSSTESPVVRIVYAIGWAKKNSGQVTDGRLFYTLYLLK